MLPTYKALPLPFSYFTLTLTIPLSIPPSLPSCHSLSLFPSLLPQCLPVATVWTCTHTIQWRYILRSMHLCAEDSKRLAGDILQICWTLWVCVWMGWGVEVVVGGSRENQGRVKAKCSTKNRGTELTFFSLNQTHFPSLLLFPLLFIAPPPLKLYLFPPPHPQTSLLLPHFCS